MDCLTITQRIRIIKTYYKHGDSATATHRALRGDYGLHNHPTMQAMGKIVKKFEETGVVTNILKGLCIIVSLVPLKTSLFRPEGADYSSFSGIRTVSRHIIACFLFRSTTTSV